MGVKYRLSYCNKDATPLRIDIEDSSYSGAIIPIIGADNPFSLRMNNDEEFIKLGTIRATDALMDFRSTDDFNIDILADSSETKLNIKFYFNNVLEWTGFILPDFFQETIGGQNIISITGTDRLGILKDIPFPDIYNDTSLLDILKRCLLETGLSLNIVTVIGYHAKGKSLDNRPLEIQVLGERLFNQGGDSLSCYDVLTSVLDTFNCFITQFRGKWHIINKQQLELGIGTVIEYNSTVGNNTIVYEGNYSRTLHFMDKVYSGGERRLRPVLSDVGILGEIGGSRLYPKNNNFRSWSGSAFANWTAYNGFVVGNYVNNPDSYNSSTGKINAFTAGSTNKLDNNNTFPATGGGVNMNTARFLQSDAIPIVLGGGGIERTVDIEYSFDLISRNQSLAVFTIILETPIAGKKYYLLNGANSTFEYAGENINNLNHRSDGMPFMIQVASGYARIIAKEVVLDGDSSYTTAVQTNIKGSAQLNSTIIDNRLFDDCKLYVRIYNVADYINVATASNIQSVVNNVTIAVKHPNDNQKGTLYRATRNGNFTAKTNIKTSVYSDYLSKGLNGYFYNYASDDTSILQANGLWTTVYDSNEFPVLRHTVRQISKLYAVVHSDYNLTIRSPRINIFDVYGIFCRDSVGVISSYTIDYLRSEVSFTMSEIKASTNPDNEYIYTYFGDEGGTNVSSLSSISGGGNGGGGGSQDLQQVLNIGNVGDKMIIEDLLVIPLQQPDVADMQDGAIWVDDSGVNPSPVVANLDDLSNVVISSPTNNQVLTYNSTTGVWENKAGGGGGGSQNLDSVLAQGNSSDRIGGILLSGNGEGYGYRLKFGAEIYGSPVNQKLYFKASDGYYLASFTPSTKQMLVVNPDSSISYEAIPSGGGGGGTVTSVGMSMPTGFSVSNSPVTTNGTIGITFASGYSLPTTTKQSQWDTAYTERHTHSNKTVLDGITSTLVTNWNTAYTERHTHSNKANLDTVNQNLGTSDSVSFSGVTATSTMVIPTVAPSTVVNGSLWRGTGVTATPIDGELNGLDDVEITTPSNGQVLSYNSTTSKWENKTNSGGGGSKWDSTEW